MPKTALLQKEVDEGRDTTWRGKEGEEEADGACRQGPRPPPSSSSFHLPYFYSLLSPLFVLNITHFITPPMPLSSKNI
jgi:hypothetical protein